MNRGKKMDGNVTNTKNYNAVVRGKVFRCAVIKRANTERCGSLLKNLRTQHSFGQDLYPRTMEIAHNMLNKHELLNAHKRKPKKEHQHEDDPSKEESSKKGGRYNGQHFAQTGSKEELVARTDGRLIAHITCYKYNRKGYYSDNCPENEEDNDNGGTKNTGKQHMKE